MPDEGPEKGPDPEGPEKGPDPAICSIYSCKPPISHGMKRGRILRFARFILANHLFLMVCCPLKLNVFGNWVDATTLCFEELMERQSL
jgi:hypothetical protein